METHEFEESLDYYRYMKGLCAVCGLDFEEGNHVAEEEDV